METSYFNLEIWANKKNVARPALIENSQKNFQSLSYLGWFIYISDTFLRCKMDELLKKLNYKGESRIALLYADEYYENKFTVLFGEKIQIDTDIDPRFPYSFMIVFVESSIEIKKLTQRLLHNLVYGGVIWFCIPSNHRGLSVNRGWKSLFDAGMSRKNIVDIDDKRVAIEFLNPEFEG